MANLICAKCGKQIEEENLIECPFCWEIYHKECWEETKFCLNCKKYNLDFARIQEEKELQAEQESEQHKEISANEGQEDSDEMGFEVPAKEMNHSPIANSILLVSKVLLIVGAVAGLAFAAYMVFATRSLIGGIFGVVIGAVFAATGWAISVLVNGFAELINNSQKNAYYLSKMIEKKEDKQWEK